MRVRVKNTEYYHFAVAILGILSLGGKGALDVGEPPQQVNIDPMTCAWASKKRKSNHSSNIHFSQTIQETVLSR